MAQYMVDLSLETAMLYEKIAQQSGYPVEKVLADALFKLAGELSLEAICQRKKQRDG